MQFCFMPDAIFIVRQMQEKYHAKGKTLYLFFVDLEKAFVRVPRKVLWRALRKFLVPEWLVKIIQAMYYNPSSKVRVESNYSDSFGVNVGVRCLSLHLKLCRRISVQAAHGKSYMQTIW